MRYIARQIRIHVEGKSMKRLVCAALILLAACSVSMGGPSPVEYDTAAIRFDANTTPAAAAAQLRQLGVDLALISTPNDAAWVRQVAQEARLTSTDPGRIGDLTHAFLAFKVEGDTTISLKVPSGGNVHLHDALYNIDKQRHLDLMTAVIEPGTSVQDAVTTLLGYVATDVPSTAAVALAVHAPTPAAADSVARLTGAYWADAWECTEQGRKGERAPPSTLRLFYFPSARVRCEQARAADPSRLIVAKLFAAD
jgi:hypothetical protein